MIFRNRYKFYVYSKSATSPQPSINNLGVPLKWGFFFKLCIILNLCAANKKSPKLFWFVCVTDPAGTAEKVDILISASSIMELMEEVQCPVCKDRMTAPITFCEKGDNVCCTWRESLDECPNCSHQFSGIRHINLEKISSWSNFSCPHLSYGDGPCWTNGWLFSHLHTEEGNFSSEQNNVNCLSMGRTS